MKSNATELVFILDRSGSMGSSESDTIGGFNSMLAKQQAEPGEYRITKRNRRVIQGGCGRREY